MTQAAKAVGVPRSILYDWAEFYDIDVVKLRKPLPYLCQCGEDDPKNFRPKNHKTCYRCLSKKLVESPTYDHSHRLLMMAEWHARNADDRYKKGKARKEFLRDWLMRYKAEVSCVVCGEDHPAVLEFHHRDPGTKRYELSVMVSRAMTISSMLEEIDKCDVLCANCHRKLHNAFKYDHIIQDRKKGRYA